MPWRKNALVEEREKNEFRFRFQDEENIKNKNLLILNESQKVFL